MLEFDVEFNLPFSIFRDAFEWLLDGISIGEIWG